MTPNHTPGPWEVHEGDDYLDVRKVGADEVICRIMHPNDADRENARLIVAAPSL